MKVFGLICLLYLSLDVSGKVFYVREDGRKGECVLLQYKPGGKKVAMSPIKAPVAKMQEDALSGLIGTIGKSATLSMHSMNAIKAFAGTMANIAPKLGPCLGVFGAAFGMLDAFTKPKLSDVLGAVNKAIGKLTDEVNDRLESMKGYVDEKVIEMERDLTKREYQHLFDMLEECAKKFDKHSADRCMENTDTIQDAAYAKFAIFAEEINAGDIDDYKIKRIEMNLLTFRNYVLLRLMTMKALMETYDSDDKPEHAEGMKRNIKQDVERYIKYVNRAYELIRKHHLVSNTFRSTMKCDSLSEVNEGTWPFKVHTADRTTCKCYIDPMLKNNEDAKCALQLTLRADGKSVYRSYLVSRNNNKEAAPQVARQILRPAVNRYLEALGKAIENYWTSEVLSLIPDWEKVAGI